VKNVSEAEKDENSAILLKQLIGQFPSPKKFLSLVHFHTEKGREIIFFKLAVDILENYYKIREKPLFGRLQKEVFPLALKFYSVINDETLNEITDMLKTTVRKSIFLINNLAKIEDQGWFVMQKKKKDIIKYYQEQTIEYDNLLLFNFYCNCRK